MGLAGYVKNLAVISFPSISDHVLTFSSFPRAEKTTPDIFTGNIVAGAIKPSSTTLELKQRPRPTKIDQETQADQVDKSNTTF